MRPILPVAALALVLTSNEAAADSPVIHRFTLDNGLKVVVEPSQRSERALVLVRYDAGGRDDPLGYRGLAHLTEHLSFRANKVLTDYDDLGATACNGVTTADHTYYYAHVPTAALERAIWIESERMAFLLSDLTERDLAHEQRIVTHEWRQHTHNVAPVSAAMTRAAFPEQHPYRLLGDDPDDIAAIELSHVQWFAQSVYRPDRATLVVTGGVDPEHVRAFATRYFGPVRATALPLARSTPAPLGPLGRHCTIRIGTRTVDRSVSLTWTEPSPDSDAAAALDVTAALLVGPRQARLTRALTRADGPASDVTLTRTAFVLANLLTIDMTARNGEALEPMVAHVEQELRALAAGKLSETELSAARAHVLKRDDREASEPVTRALALADARDDASLTRRRARHERVSVDDVKRVASRWLDPRRRVLMRLDCTRCTRDEVRCEEVGP